MKRMLRRRKNEVPELNTAALPDLIFTVLFFFMIVTHMRDVELQVRYQVPKGTEVQKLAHKSSVVDIYIGKVAEKDSFQLQLNNRLASIEDIKDFIEEERSCMTEEDRQRMTVSIKADCDVPMGMVADVKRVLQESYALRISYSAASLD